MKENYITFLTDKHISYPLVEDEPIEKEEEEEGEEEQEDEDEEEESLEDNTSQENKDDEDEDEDTYFDEKDIEGTEENKDDSTSISIIDSFDSDDEASEEAEENESPEEEADEAESGEEEREEEEEENLSDFDEGEEEEEGEDSEGEDEKVKVGFYSLNNKESKPVLTKKIVESIDNINNIIIDTPKKKVLEIEIRETSNKDLFELNKKLYNYLISFDGTLNPYNPLTIARDILRNDAQLELPDFDLDPLMDCWVYDINLNDFSGQSRDLLAHIEIIRNEHFGYTTRIGVFSNSPEEIE